MNGHKQLLLTNVFIEDAHEAGFSLTHLQLQKIIFLAHGHNLVETGKPLFEGAFLAWEHGPVLSAVFREFTHFKDGPISPCRRIGFRQPGLDAWEKDVEAQNLIRRVIAKYGHWDPWDLVKYVHAPGGPWDQVRKDAQAQGLQSLPIPNKKIRMFFVESMPPLPFLDLEEATH